MMESEAQISLFQFVLEFLENVELLLFKLDFKQLY